MGQLRQFQEESGKWVIDKFGEEVYSNLTERGIRTFEEATEFAQSVGVEPFTLLKILVQVLSKEKGEPMQELAGILHTVFSAADALGQDLETHYLAETERINKLPASYFVERRSRKVKAE